MNLEKFGMKTKDMVLKELKGLYYATNCRGMVIPTSKFGNKPSYLYDLKYLKYLLEWDGYDSNRDRPITIHRISIENQIIIKDADDFRKYCLNVYNSSFINYALDHKK